MRFLARLKLRRFHKQMIGITGTVGKSTTKEALVQVLAPDYSILPTHADYNTELGLLCSLFRMTSGFQSASSWRRAMAVATWRFLTDHRRYEMLVLEMGVGAPGGMSDMLQTFRPGISIFTGVAPGHLDEFGDESGVFEEKVKLVRTMKRGTVILNRDEPSCRRLESEPLRAERLWYGRLPEGQAVDALPPGLYFDRAGASGGGITAELHVSRPGAFPGLRAASHRLSCPILGEHHLYSLLPALLTGLVMGLDLEQACWRLSMFALPPSRMTAIPGIRSSTLIDSSWNASPRAVEAALRTLGDFPARRRIALLGCMQKLGDASEAAHRGVGRVIPRYAQMLLTVGPEARRFAEAARDSGMPADRVHTFEASEEAARYLKGLVRAGDVILVKGATSLYLDRAVQILMRDPEQADQLLFRR